MVVNNKLTADYAGKPVVIVGYDNPSNIAAYRKTRYYAADPNSPVTLPHLMVDSGRKTLRGGTSDQNYYYTKSKTMIDSELGRAPQAALSATYKRVGNHVEFSVKVTNQSGVTLYSSTNKAAVHAVVYETFTNTTRPSYALVNTFGRVTAYKSISTALANGKTGTYALVTPDLPSTTKWANLRYLVMVDYRPGSTGAYDMLQAAFAAPAATAYNTLPGSLSALAGGLPEITGKALAAAGTLLPVTYTAGATGQCQ